MNNNHKIISPYSASPKVQGIFSEKSLSWGTHLFGKNIYGEVILDWRTKVSRHRCKECYDFQFGT